jgi:hypothetical protein
LARFGGLFHMCCLTRRLFRYIKTIMATVTDLTTAVAKLSADLDTYIAADQAKDAKIADLTAQLAAFANDAAAVDNAVQMIDAMDAKVAPPPAPAA